MKSLEELIENKKWLEGLIEQIELGEVDNVELDGIDTNDYPDFCDAFIASADYNGVNMTDDQLEKLNEYRDYVYELVLNELF